MGRMRRAVGYCLNIITCEDVFKGVFLLNSPGMFYCPRCRKAGHNEPEVGKYEGDGRIFREVRVEYNYDAAQERYTELAVVRDDARWGNASVYTLKSPLVKTEKRALKIAEAILANLNRYGLTDGAIPSTADTIISFDDDLDTLKHNLDRLHRMWTDRERNAVNG